LEPTVEAGLRNEHVDKQLLVVCLLLDESHLEEKLNEIAAEGWELVSAVIDVPSYTLIFKRAA
jgi:hypothetical protein